jgi:hypothetical protein
LQRTGSDKPWAFLPLQLGTVLEDLYSMTVVTEIGDGTNTLFWEDRWITSQRIRDIALAMVNMVPKKWIKKRTVHEALQNACWIQDIHGQVSIQLILEFLSLWDLSGFTLHQGVPDTHIWRLSSTSQYSAKSAYEALCQGSIKFDPWTRIWKSWAPRKCKFFLWLAAHDRCWTADRLARRNLPHPELCPLCDQEKETINHLLSSCVFTREFWFILLQMVRLGDLAPQAEESIFQEWWQRVLSLVSSPYKKGLSSLIILGAWTLWRHHNDCVFNGSAPRIATALAMAGEQIVAWNMADTKGLAMISDFGEELEG